MSKENNRWVMFGCGGETFVGELHKQDYEDFEELNPSQPISFETVYKVSTHAIPLQEKNALGQVVGVNLSMQIFVSSPGLCPVDVGMSCIPSWILFAESDPEIAAHVEKIVKMAKAQQQSIRAASSGIALR